MRFKVYGPFEIPRNGRLVSRNAREKREYWQWIEDEEEGLSFACGCYVLTIRNRAWYVGAAERQSFRAECLSLHKIVQYDSALQSAPGRPQLIFIAKRTPGDRFAKPSGRGHSDIHVLENLLMGMALVRNERVQNARGTKFLRNMNVPGVLNTTQGQAKARAVRALKRALGR